MKRIFHISTPRKWRDAQQNEQYTVSTRDVSLGAEGYIHCSEEGQIEGVVQRSYSDLAEIVVLEIDTDLLTSPWRMEQLAGVDEPYPHIFGPLNLDAVVQMRPWSRAKTRRGNPGSMSNRSGR